MPAPHPIAAIPLEAGPLGPGPLPRIDFWRLVQGVAVVFFFAAWLVVIAHAGLLLAAEWRLASILREANAFAQLPDVNSRELTDVVRAEVQAAGLGTPRVLVIPSTRVERGLEVARIETSANHALPAWLRRITPPVERPLRAVK